LNQAYEVKLATFEGPLDLLLHLINQYEIDIYDIPVAEMTKQYMHYIQTMEELELNIASEYLVMAATLLAIKSHMLLPKQKIIDDIDEYVEDPREELMERLIEYRKYKEAAEVLKDKEFEANQTFTRPPINFPDAELKTPVVKGDLSIYDMLEALNKMFVRKEWDQPLGTKVTRVEVSMAETMQSILTIVGHAKNGVSFDALFTHPTRSHIVVTFISLLELMKNNDVYCKQEGNFSALYVYTRS